MTCGADQHAALMADNWFLMALQQWPSSVAHQCTGILLGSRTSVIAGQSATQSWRQKDIHDGNPLELTDHVVGSS